MGSSMFGKKPVFGTPSTPRFGSSPSPTFGQSTLPFGNSNLSGNTVSPFGSSSGAQTKMASFGTTQFGQTAFCGQGGGSRLASYTKTAELDGGKLVSVSAISSYKIKSHEELRWEDYQLGDKGGVGVGISTIQPNPFRPLTASSFPSSRVSSTAFISPPISTSSSTNFLSTTSAFTPTFVTPLTPLSLTNSSPSFTSSPSIFNSTSSTPGWSPVNEFPSSTLSNLFPLQTSPFSSAPNTIPTAFISPPISTSYSTNFFPTTSAFTPTYVTQSATAFTSSPSIISFNSPTPGWSLVNPFSSSTPSNPFSIQTSPFSSAPCTFSTCVAVSPPFTSSSILDSISAPEITFVSTLNTSAPGTDSKFCPGLSSTFTQPSPLYQFPSPSTNDLSLPTSSAVFKIKPNTFASPLSDLDKIPPSIQPQHLMTNLNCSSQTIPSFWTPSQPAQPQTAQIQGRGSCQSTTAQQYASPVAVQPTSVSSAFGMLPAIPHISTGPRPPLQHGISSLPVSEKQVRVPVGISSSLTIRHLSRRRNRFPVPKYDPKNDSRKVPFFTDGHETPNKGMADFLITPRENPRSLVICPTEQWPLRSYSEKLYLNPTFVPLYEDGEVSMKASAPFPTVNIYEDKDGNSSENNTGKGCAGDVLALMPKLQSSGYYTEPQIEELATKEKSEPGFCSHVKDFVVGRSGYGSIKFWGVTDVRGLDLESLIQFNNREVIVYMDESKKPPVGQGLNKPAEVTLLNIKCIEKKTGKQHIDGPKVEKYREMLIKKAEDQGAEFVSYDPAQGVWKFRVKHFS